MGRWEPGAAGRLREAAMELYLERGFEQTTVADIGERAGVTARTFFRYFADKREVLFAGSEVLQDTMIEAATGAPDGASPMAAVTAALDAAAAYLPDRQYAARRHSVITANGELRERELTKMAALTRGLAAALRGRGVPEPQASLAAESGVTIFRVAFERWVTAEDDQDLVLLMHEILEQLHVVTGG